MAAVDHRLALNGPALPSAPAKKSFSTVSSPIFAWRDFTSTAGAVSFALAAGPAKQPGGPLKQLGLPGGDLVGMDIVRLCQLGQRLLAS